MPDGRPLFGRIWRARSGARLGLLSCAVVAVAVAVATACALAGWLIRAVAAGADATPPGVTAADVAVQVQSGTVALVAAAPALGLAVVVLAGTAIAQLGRLLTASRGYENVVLRGRGLSRAQAVGLDATEVSVVCLAGGLLGWLTVLVASSWTGGGAPAAVSATWPAAVVTALVLGVILLLALRPRSDLVAGRAARAAATGTVALVLLAAALTLWQLGRARPGRFDAFVVVTPTVILLAGAIAAFAMFSLAAAAWSVVSARRPTLAPAYPARQVARRVPVYAVAVLLIGLTIAQVVFTAAYSETWLTTVTRSASIRTGADLRVDLRPDTATPASVARAASVAGVDAVAPVLVAPIALGSTDAELVAVPSEKISEVIAASGGAVDPAELEADLTPADGSVAADPVPLGEAASGLRITVDVRPPGATDSVGLRATLLDAHGTPTTLRMPWTSVTDGGDTVSATAATSLPEGAGPWRLLAVTTSLALGVSATRTTVEIVDAVADDGTVLDVRGEATFTTDDREQVLWRADGGASGGDAQPPVRVAVSVELAERLNLSPGDSLEFRYTGTGRRGELSVGATVDFVPGASTALAVFAPLEIVTVSMLQRGASSIPPASVWAAGDVAAADALSADFDDRPVATAAPGVTAGIVGALVPAWWITTAGSSALCLIAAFAIVQTLALARRRERGVLRAMGVSASDQARMHSGELGAVIGASVALGAATGALAAALCVPPMVRAVTPGVLDLGDGVGFAWGPLGICVGVIVLALAAIVAVSAAAVAHAGSHDTVGEEPR